MQKRLNRRIMGAALVAALGLGIVACVVEEEPSPAADTGAAATDTAAGARVAADAEAVTVADAGLETPESVLHDDQADIYLVSNINGQPTGKDDNGFISRVRPDGTVDQLRWIDGAASDDVTLHAPKGLALKGDTLFVSDIDTVRAFHRTTGTPLGEWGVSGATFLNDLAVDANGTLYVSDSGLNPDFSSSGTDAIYRFEGGSAAAVLADTALSSPNGLAAGDGDLFVAPFGSNQVLRLAAGADTAEVVATLPGGQLDGIVRLDDASFLVSSWETQSVYRVPTGGGQVMAVVEGVPSPADIGYDAQRGRVLIPVFMENRLEFRTVQ